jgi:hypothetical protein
MLQDKFEYCMTSVMLPFTGVIPFPEGGNWKLVNQVVVYTNETENYTEPLPTHSVNRSKYKSSYLQLTWEKLVEKKEGEGTW